MANNFVHEKGKPGFTRLPLVKSLTEDEVKMAIITTD